MLVALRPRLGAYVVAGWLLAIILNLLLIPGFFDIALRDFGLCLGAIALGRLSAQYASGHGQNSSCNSSLRTKMPGFEMPCRCC